MYACFQGEGPLNEQVTSLRQKSINPKKSILRKGNELTGITRSSDVQRSRDHAKENLQIKWKRKPGARQMYQGFILRPTRIFNGKKMQFTFHKVYFYSWRINKERGNKMTPEPRNPLYQMYPTSNLANVCPLLTFLLSPVNLAAFSISPVPSPVPTMHKRHG